MKNLPLIILLFFSFQINAQTFNTADSLALLKIDAECDLLDSLNWNREPNPLNWEGVTWDSLVPRRVNKLEIERKELSGILNIMPLDSLAVLNCNNNEIEFLLLNNLTKLYDVQCRYNKLPYLDISTLTKLKDLNASDNGIYEIKMPTTNNPNLIMLNLGYNELKDIRLTELPNLNYLDLSGNLFYDSPYVRSNDSLEYLGCSGMNIDRLEVSNLIKLKVLWCSENKLSRLNLRNQKYLSELSCWGNSLTELDLSANKYLVWLTCSYNKLTQLDVSENYYLVQFSCEHNELTKLKLGTHRGIQSFNCSDNQLNEIDLSGIEWLLGCNVKNNKLPFSSLATGLHSESILYPQAQNKLFASQSYYGDTILDYSAEALINESSYTVFAFYKDDVEVETNTTGIFNTTGSGVYHCEMTNELFPGLTLTTSPVTVEKGLGVERFTDTYNVYPNPAKDILIVENLKRERGQYQVRLYNSTGKMVYNNSILNQETTQLNLSDLLRGIYVLSIENNGTIFIEKIVLQ